MFWVLNKTIPLLTPRGNICNVVLEPILSLNNFKLDLSISWATYQTGENTGVSSASFSVLVSQPQIPSLVSLKGMCISLCSFIKKIITQLSPGGLAHADWLFKLLPLYWSSVWKDSNRFILPKAKCFVLDEFLRAECKRWHEKEAFLGWNYAWTMVVVWKIVAVKVLGHWWSGSDQLCLFWTAHNWQTFGGKEGPPAL